MEPLVFGLLGSARITTNGIVIPAAATGARLRAIAARDRDRAERAAAEHGIECVYDDYLDVILDPEVTAVYNPLVNSEHARWNLAAIAAGKHVLSEKPFAANAEEAAAVRDAAAAAGVVVADGSHFVHHPLTRRLHELLGSGRIGEVRHVETHMMIPAPPDGDPRWDLALGGGGLMDLGCYSIRALRGIGPLLGGEPSVVTASGRERVGRAGVDEYVEAELAFPSGATARLVSDMAGDGYEMSFVVTGSRGEASLGNFALPHLDPTMRCRAGDRETVEDLGTISSYTYQLDAFRSAVAGGAALATDAADAVETMLLVDATYRAAGFEPRLGARP